jgi:hypothetical protein
LYERLYNAITKLNAGAVKSGMLAIKDENLVPPYPKTESKVKALQTTFTYHDEFIPKNEFFLKVLRKEADIAVWNIMLKTQLAKKVKFWNRYSEDFHFQAELMKHIEGYYTIKEHGYLYVQHPGSAVATRSAENMLDYGIALTLLFEQVKDNSDISLRYAILSTAKAIYTSSLKKTNKNNVNVLNDLIAMTEFFKKYTV